MAPLESLHLVVADALEVTRCGQSVAQTVFKAMHGSTLELSDWLTWNLSQILIIPRGWILKTLLIFWLSCWNTSRSAYSLPDDHLSTFTLRQILQKNTRRRKFDGIPLFRWPIFPKPESSAGSKVHLFSSLLSWKHLHIAPKINTFPAVVSSVTAGPVHSAESGPILDVVLST